MHRLFLGTDIVHFSFSCYYHVRKIYGSIGYEKVNDENVADYLRRLYMTKFPEEVVDLGLLQCRQWKKCKQLSNSSMAT